MLTTIAVAIAGTLTLVARDADRARSTEPEREAAAAPVEGPVVPDVTHTYLKDARVLLQQRGLEAVIVERRVKTYLCASFMRCPKPFDGWRVLEQQPRAGGRAPFGSPLVGLIVQRSTSPRSVPGYDAPSHWTHCCAP
jgi:hypothetical protein